MEALGPQVLLQMSIRDQYWVVWGLDGDPYLKYLGIGFHDNAGYSLVLQQLQIDYMSLGRDWKGQKNTVER